MSKTIAVFGAGTGLGTSIAHRFGREGYRIALVARRNLDTMVARLAADGIEAAAFTADLSRTADIPALVAAIRARFGSIDVIEYAPISTVGFVPATELDADKLQALVNLYMLTPVELVRAVLPEMLERGDGGILIGHGLTAAQPMPYLSGLGPVTAAARNYIYSLNGELADKGVYAGTLTVAAMIARSEGHRALLAGELNIPDGIELPTVDPDELAELFWNMLAKRDRVEEVYPPVQASGVAREAKVDAAV